MPLARGRCQCWLCKGRVIRQRSSGSKRPARAPLASCPSAQSYSRPAKQVSALPRGRGAATSPQVPNAEMYLCPPLSPLPPAPRDREPAGRIRPLLPPGRDGAAQVTHGGAGAGAPPPQPHRCPKPPVNPPAAGGPPRAGSATPAPPPQVARGPVRGSPQEGCASFRGEGAHAWGGQVLPATPGGWKVLPAVQAAGAVMLRGAPGSRGEKGIPVSRLFPGGDEGFKTQ